MLKEKQKKNSKVSARHKLVLRNISENIRNGMTMEQAMLEAGYSTSYAKSSTHLKDTKSWDVLIKAYLPEEQLAKLHQEQLKAQKIQNIGRKPQMYPDNDARLKALDLGYKLHGKYKPEAHDLKFAGFSKEQLIDYIMLKITKSSNQSR